MDYGFIAQYDELRDTIVSMVRQDKSLMGDDAYLPAPDSADMHYIEDAGDKIVVQGGVWTNLFGGSTESYALEIPKADIELFQLKWRLAAEVSTHDGHAERVANTVGRPT